MLTVIADTSWIKSLSFTDDGEHLFARNVLWFAFVEMDNALVARFFTLGIHRFIQDLRVDQGHFGRSMSHPLLDHDQTHAIVQQFHAFGMPESVEAKMKDLSLFVLDLILFCQVIESHAHSSLSQRLPSRKALTRLHPF